MVNDVAISIGAISSDELHETASSIKSNENVIDTSVFKITPEPCKSGVPGAGDIRLRQPVFEGVGGWIAMSSIRASLFVYSFVDKNASS